jgi:transcriptional regulator with PAS, ATPase and Fis domain
MRLHRASPNTNAAIRPTTGQLNLFASHDPIAIADIYPDGVIAVDPCGNVIFVNKAFLKGFRFREEDCLGKPIGAVAELFLTSKHGLELAVGASMNTQRLETGLAAEEILVTTRVLNVLGSEAKLLIVIIRVVKQFMQGAEDAKRGSRVLTLDQLAKTERRAQETYVLDQQLATLLDYGMRAMKMRSRILVVGESGVGKTGFSRILHERTHGNSSPFVAVNCCAIPATLLESELFGYERGSFSGASSRGKVGLVEAAKGGTLFLDEIGDMPIEMQVKLLKFLEEGKIQKVGATEEIEVRTNVICATNCDLMGMVRAGRFRKDLFYRINVLTLRLPPLRQSRDILPDLIETFVDEVSRRRGYRLEIDDSCLDYLLNYGYPGNVRELQNIIQHLAVVADNVATIADLPDFVLDLAHAGSGGGHEPTSALDENEVMGMDAESGPSEGICPQSVSGDSGGTLRDRVRKAEARIIREAINAYGSKRKAAGALGVDIATIVRKTRHTRE